MILSSQRKPSQNTLTRGLIHYIWLSTARSIKMYLSHYLSCHRDQATDYFPSYHLGQEEWDRLFGCYENSFTALVNRSDDRQASSSSRQDCDVLSPEQSSTTSALLQPRRNCFAVHGTVSNFFESYNGEVPTGHSSSALASAPCPEVTFRVSTRSSRSHSVTHVKINISGLIFEIHANCLARHPETLLGNPEKRATYYDAIRHEYFFDRHRPSFESIFNYYLRGGTLKRPLHVPDEIFLSELHFFQIETETIEAYKRHEGYVTEVIILPENSRKRYFWTLFEYPETSNFALLIAVISVFFTSISIILFCVETLPTFASTHCVNHSAPNFLDPFFIVESICTLWFTSEALIRFCTCPSKPAFAQDVKNMVDLAAIVPYYITLFNVLTSYNCHGAKSSASLAFLRVIRLVRVFKLTKHSAGLQVLILTFRASIEGLCLFLVALAVCIVVFSSAIYYAEVGSKDSQIDSIPDAFWWSIITMCTVGYGDKVPKSSLGKLVGSFCAIAGVLTLAIPVPIITENFNKFYAHKTQRIRRDPSTT